MKSYSNFRRVCGLLLMSVVPAITSAQPLDDVTLEYQSQGVVATIRLTGPVQYLRHFPESHGKTLEINYDRVAGATSAEIWVDGEVRKSPSSGLIPSFTVTTRDQQTKPRLVIEFAREAEYSVAAGKDGRSLLVTIRPEKRQVSDEPLPFLPAVKPLPKAAAGATPTAEQAAAADTNMQAHALMVQGRDALAAKNNEAAVDALNKLLLLPPNDYTQDGQEWIGVARDRAGQDAKAKVEYDLYLRLYPDGAGAARVAKRLAGVAGAEVGKPMTEVAEPKKKSSLMTYGSVSTRYYYGRSTIESTYTFNNAVTTDTLSLTDQSMLITSVDASERFRSEDTDARLVFRDVDTRNFLSNQPSRNRVSAAYGEIKGRAQEYLVRVGRQSSMGGGVLGRFDGLTGAYGNQDLRVNGVAGSLVDYSQGSKPRFVGASVDKGEFSVYAIDQTVEGVQDRRALGAEYRYFDDKRSAFALLDYDTYFKAVNAAQFIGTSRLNEATVNFMVDHRKAPSLSIRNALNGASTSSVNALLQTMSASSLRDLALSRTAVSNMGQVGVTMPLREKWQAGGDVRLTNTTGLPTSGAAPVNGIPAPEGYLEEIPSRGLEKSLTGQIIGSGLYRQGDIWSGSVTLSTSSAVNGRFVYFYNHTQFNNGWSLDSSLQLSGYKDQYGGKTTRTSPMVRGAYRIREQLYVDVDCGYEYIGYSGVQMSSKTQRFSLSTGLRWDF
ncbi:MAG: hypothetical protein Q7U91_01145 [Sideroxyarcus sp.]|nr:hypothetical protein [Sideroxyarcus sp.]